MTDASRALVALAERVSSIYLSETHPRAILLTGSAATGESDFYSDLDLIFYHNELPSDAELAAARERIECDEILYIGGDRDQGHYLETYFLDGIECQLGHTTVAAWERDLATVLEGMDVTFPTQKAIDGILHGIPLHGLDLIAKWCQIARAYPDGLARAIVVKHLHFFPLWRLQDRLQTRDATLWYHQILVEASQNLLAVLAGVNRLYFSTFQFKRMHAFVARMRIAPDNLADRIDRLFIANAQDAAEDLERLVADTVDLVEAYLPDVDVRKVRRHLGQRDRPWGP